MQAKIRALKADIEEAEAAEDLWPCPPNEKRIAFSIFLSCANCCAFSIDLEAIA